MRKKEAGSLNSLGRTNIVIDKQLRADIKNQAAKQGVSMVEYLRLVVEAEKRGYSETVINQVASAMAVQPNNFDAKMLSFFSFMDRLEEKIYQTAMVPGKWASEHSDDVRDAPLVPPMLKAAVKQMIDEVLEEMKDDPKFKPQES